MLDSGSVVVQATVTFPMYQPLVPRVPVMVGVMSGAVWSILMVTGTDVERPAPLVAEQVSVVPGVLAVNVWVAQPVEVAMPDSGSEVVQLTVTGPVYQPFAPVGPVMVGVMSGAVLSILTVMGTEAERPALLVAEQVNAEPVVLAVRVCVAHPVEEAMPDSGSVVVHETMTGPVYQPLAPAAPVMVGVTTGGVVSNGTLLIFTVTDTVLTSPAALVAEQVRVVPGVFAVRVTLPFASPHPDAAVSPESGSDTLQVTVTSLV